jgi:hypothetical protein
MTEILKEVPAPAQLGEPILDAVEAYCVKCKTKRNMKDPRKVTMKNGRHAAQGKCETCNTGLYKILAKK